MSFGGMGAGTAATIVGGEIQGWAAKLAKEKMDEAYKQAQAEQQGFVRKGGELMKGITATGGYDQAQLDLAKGEASRNAMYDQVGQQPLGLDLKSQSTYSDSADQAWARMRGQAKATLGSYGDWALNQSLRQIQNQEAIRELASSAAGQAGVAPYRMYEAQHSKDDMALIGQAISSLGGGSMNFAQYSQTPPSNNYSRSGGGISDPYGAHYQVNPQGQFFSGQPNTVDNSLMNAYSGQGYIDPSVGAALALW